MPTHGEPARAILVCHPRGADGLYRAGNLALPKGGSDLAVTGRDPQRPGNFVLIFRIEKQITVE